MKKNIKNTMLWVCKYIKLRKYQKRIEIYCHKEIE